MKAPTVDYQKQLVVLVYVMTPLCDVHYRLENVSHACDLASLNWLHEGVHKTDCRAKFFCKFL